MTFDRRALGTRLLNLKNDDKRTGDVKITLRLQAGRDLLKELTSLVRSCRDNVPKFEKIKIIVVFLQ